ncbi:hypothetical protein BRD09_07660 [Halobacteriales archaeon SW_10_68_16]|jgi:CheY-like chemotaxis protein|nr:MAG: hypothetical protein BRD09_07660 [Halobacteriales archaeon SW_10_68_16]
MAAEDPHILVVDDNERLRELYSLWLRPDHEVSTAADGSAALDALADGIEVVLLDREMPGLSGIEVARAIDESEHDPFVVMVSSMPPDFDLIEYPVDDYLQKPVGEADVRDVVETYRAQCEYLAAVDELFALMAKVATIEANHDEDELEANDEYVRLRVRLEEKRTEVYGDLLEAKPDWEATFRAVARDVGSTDMASVDAGVDLPNGFG